ncbi:MAG TPA: HAMP domain-containing sensor histidine kinase [Nocardioides sp.]|nr:HAMP domain-containing sensor histidine kinase [Nocardioides sp.]
MHQTVSGAPGIEVTGTLARTERLFVPWLLLAWACVAWMWVVPGGEVVPFHLIWIVFALVYGFEPWPVVRTLVALGLLGLASGGILVWRAWTGVVAWEETAEIALMLLLALLVLAHVRRRQEALAAVTRLAQARIGAARERERLARLTSHEMRTPLAIATGYVDLLLRGDPEDERRQDLEVVRDELGRLARAGDRLLRMIRLQDLLDRTTVDLSELITDTVERWSVVADRDWQVEPQGGHLDASPERLRACVDTLIENAVRHTPEGGTVRVFCTGRPGSVWIGVADSGPGFTAAQRGWLNAAAPRRSTVPRTGLAPGQHTGFGLGIVREIIESRHGAVRAGTAREGGALVLMTLPSAVVPLPGLSG